jgi:hypothetical protein
MRSALQPAPLHILALLPYTFICTLHESLIHALNCNKRGIFCCYVLSVWWGNTDSAWVHMDNEECSSSQLAFRCRVSSDIACTWNFTLLFERCIRAVLGLHYRIEVVFRPSVCSSHVQINHRRSGARHSCREIRVVFVGGETGEIPRHWFCSPLASD